MKKIEVKTKYKLLILAITAVSAILCVALVFYIKSSPVNFNAFPLQTIIILATFLISLPILLLVFLIIMRLKRKRASAGEIDYIDGEVNYIDATEESGEGQTKGKGKEAKKNKESGTRFYMLSKIDEDCAKYKRMEYDEKITLKELCENFRNYAASRLNLYYDISDIRKFIAGLAVSRIIILQGISGTGKTSLAYAFGEFLDNSSTVIPVQPMWKERTDLIGYYNEFTKKFNETTLLQKLYEANYSKDMYITLLDEMNIARIEYYFAEFLSLLELPNPEKRYLDVVSDKWESDPAQLKKGQIKLADNMWFVGTANNDDTTFSISDKVYDRAMIMNLDYKCEIFAAPKTDPVHISAERFKTLVSGALKEYEVTKRNLKRLEIVDKYLIENFHITFGNRIRKQIMTYIPVYLSCGGDELEALDDILAKKLMRKLEMQNPVHLRNQAEGFCANLDEVFGQDKMKQCKAYIMRLAKNA